MIRDYGRYIRFLKTFEGKLCQCGETQPHRLRWYPYNDTIHSNYMRWGKSTVEVKLANELMEKSTLFCVQCEADIEHARKSGEETFIQL